VGYAGPNDRKGSTVVGLGKLPASEAVVSKVSAGGRDQERRLEELARRLDGEDAPEA
jgi:hypothetical protein